MKKTFETLYKKASTGAIVEWNISVDGNKITTSWGQRGGKMQTETETISEGKNKGRANATTPEQQAMLEAEAHWVKKQKKDYNKDLKSVGKASNLIDGGLLPMLCHKFSEQGDKIKYPCFVQPKLDGHRCIAMPDGSLWSRTRKRIFGVPHIEAAVRELGLAYPLDGELYNHLYKDKFEKLTHFIRQTTPEPGHDIVQYHVYDYVVSGVDFETRSSSLKDMKLGQPLVTVKTVQASDEDGLMLAFEDFLAQGYEGAIARNANGLYVNKRSYDLQKIKQFDDAEFECIAVEEGRGRMAGHGIFVCETKDGTEFKAKMQGDLAELKKFVTNPKLVVGKLVTVKYQGLTNKNGVPRFPVALRIREDA